MRSNQWLQDQLGSPTWRATTDHMISMGYEAHEVTLYNKRGVEFMCQFRDEHEHMNVALTIFGCQHADILNKSKIILGEST